MAVAIDKEVIQMVLDVSGFQDAADEALDVIDQLKESLDFTGVADGLSEISEKTKNMGFNALQDGLFKIQEGFNALDLFALKVLSNIEDKIISVGHTLLTSITVDPIKSGLEEYETQINSVQTILANTNDALIEKGLTTEHERVEKINEVLDELNHYADMTIYNFTEMTRNIGTFTAAGVDLDTAATAIQGIANLAAMSGSNSQQASTAMYQLSQALASGTVHLQDWNSVVNAGMGGKLFQNELIETAKAMHTADETMAELESGALTFRDSLQEDWLTADVLINTLEKFTAGTEGYTKSQVESMQELWRARGYSETQIKELTGTIHQLTEEEELNLREKWAQKGFDDDQIDHILQMGTAATDAATKVKTFTQLIETLQEALQSGWTQSWEYVFGDFEQAKRFWTEISDILNLYIGKSADSRNAILEVWSQAKYSYNEDNQLINAETGELIEGQRMLASEMGGRELVIQGLRNSFQSLCEIVFQLKEAFRLNFWGEFSSEELAKMSEPLSNIKLTGEKLIELSYKFEEATASFKDSLFSTDRLARLREVFDQFATSCRTLYDTVATIIPGVKNIFDAFFHSSFFNIDILSSIASAFDYVVQAFSNFGESFNKHFGSDNAANREGLMKFFSAIQGVLETAFWTKLTFITEAFSALGSIFEHLIEPFGTISEILGYFGDKISMLVHAFDEITHDENGISKISTMFTNIADSINGFIDKVGRSLDFSGIKNIFDTIGNAITSDKVDLFGSFENIIMTVVNALQALASVVMPIATAFVNVFSPAIEEIGIFINEVTTRFRELTESLIANQTMMSGLEAFFTGVFNVLKALGELISTVFLSAWDSLGTILSSMLPNSTEMSTILKDVGNDLTSLSEVIESLITGEGGVPKLSDIMGLFTDKVKGLFDVIGNLDPLQKLHDLLDNIFKGIKHALGGTDDMSMLDTIINKLKEFMDGLKRVFSGDDGEFDFDKFFTAGGITVLIDRLIGIFKGLKDSTKDVSNIIGIVKTLVDGFTEALSAIKDRMKVDSIKMMADSLLEVAAALFVIAMIDPVALAQSVAVVELIFEAIDKLLTKISTFGASDTGDLAAAGAAIASLGISILLVSFALKMLSDIEPLELLQGLAAVIVLLEELVHVAKKFSEIDNTEGFAGAGALIMLAAALDLLIIPVKQFGEMELGQLAQGMIAVGIGLVGLVKAAQELGKAKGFGVGDAVGLILMAEAIKVLGKTIVMLKDLSWPELAKGLAVFAAGLIGMVGASAVISKGKLGDDILELGGSLMMLSTSMLMLAPALKIIGGMEWEELAKGGAVFAAALVGLGVASALIDGKNLMMIAGAIFLLATAFTELSLSIKLAEIIGPILTTLGAAFNTVKDSMVGMAQNAFNQSNLDMMKRFFTFIPELLAGIAQGIIQFIATIASSSAQLVQAVVQLGSAILQGIIQLTPQLFEALGTFLNQLWPFLSEQVPQLFEFLGMVFTQIFDFLNEQIPNFFEVLNTLLGEILNFFQTNGTEIIETIRLLIDTVLQAVIAEAPVIGETIKTLLQTALDVVETMIPSITKTILTLLNELLKQLAEFVPQMADSALKIINGFLDAVAKNIGEITKSAIDIALAFIKGITEKIDDIVDAAFKLLIGFIEGLAKAIEENHNKLFEAVGKLIKAIFDAIVDGVKTIVKGAGELLNGFMSAFDGEQLLKDLGDIGKNLVQGVINGITSFASTLWDEAGKLAQGTLDALANTFVEHSPSKKGIEIGGYLAEGLAIGIEDNADQVISNAGDMAYGTLDALSCLNDDITYTPTVTPVINDAVGSGVSGYSAQVDITQQISNGVFDIVDNQNALLEHLFDDFKKFTSDTIDTNVYDIVDNQNALLDNLFADFKKFTYDTIDNQNALLEHLFDDLTALSSKFEQMKVVLDSGTLVGELTPQIDQALGNRQMMVDRGVY